MENNNIHLIGLKIVNAGLIEALEVNFNESGVAIFAGDNRQGKSTIIKALNILLFGAKALPNDFMTHNKNKLEIKGTFNNFIITRTKTTTGDLRVSITDREGIPVNGAPQTFINNFINKEVINPQPFIEKDGKAIYDYLLEFAKIDTTDIDYELQQLENDRLFKGREKTSFGEPKPVEKAESVDISNIVKFNDEQKERQSKIEKAEDKLNNLKEKEVDVKDNINKIILEIKSLNKKLDIERKELTSLHDRILNGRKFIDEMDKPEPLKPIDNMLGQNEKAKAYQKYLIDSKKYQQLEDEYLALDSDIKQTRKKKDEMYHVALPIDGLKLTDEGAYYNDIHADNWSSEEKFNIFFELMLSVNPELRLMYLDDAEKIGSAMMEVYRRKCKKHNFLAILTQVKDYPEDTNKEPGTFYIRGGELI